MKPMSERKMGMGGGPVDSDGYFPSAAEHRKLPRAGEIKDFKYPDTDEAVHRDQEQFVKAASKNQPKPDFRH